MVSFRKYLESREDTEHLRDILGVLASCRDIPVTLNDVLARLPSETKRDTVDDKLRRAVKKGFVVALEPQSYTYGRGRPSKRYQLSKDLYNDYLKAEATPEETEYSYGFSLQLITIEEKRLRDRYFYAALKRATYEFSESQKMYRGNIPDLEEINASGKTLAECKPNLKNKLENWVGKRRREGKDIPPIGDISFDES